ncbi:Fungal specific transcription factor domain, partial [Rhizoctonia solani]
MPHLQANGPLLRHSSSNVGDLAGSTTVLNSYWSNSRSMGPPGYLSWTSSTASGISTIPSIRFCVAPAPYMTKNMAVRMSEYAHDFGPRIIWPPEGCTSCDELDPEGAAPVFRQAMMAMTQKASAHMGFPEPGIDSTFLTRLFYDYALTSDKLVNWILRRFNASNSSRHAMTAMAALYRSDYQRSIMTSSWRVDAKELYSLAFKQLPYDLEDVKLSPWEKLLGLIGVMDFEYHTGQLSKYYSHGTLATPLIKEIVGSDIIDLFKLQGDQMFDVSMWVWCDILDSMATSKPTRLKYESDLENVPSYGSEEDSTCQDRGLEWLYGIPNAFAVLLARTSAIRDAKLPEQEKMSKGSEIEQLVRNWQINPLGTKTSRLRVARVGAQEIWRHTVILYVHHAIFKSDSNHPIVRDSVKNIIKIASTLEPGGNPDSFLYIPYFIAGFYAVSQKDRYAMKSRLIGCGNALYLRNLARNLDELWHETDSAGHLTSWSQKKPPRIAF